MSATPRKLSPVSPRASLFANARSNGNHAAQDELEPAMPRESLTRPLCGIKPLVLLSVMLASLVSMPAETQAWRRRRRRQVSVISEEETNKVRQKFDEQEKRKIEIEKKRDELNHKWDTRINRTGGLTNLAKTQEARFNHFLQSPEVQSYAQEQIWDTTSEVVVAVMGLVSSGKSTLLCALAGSKVARTGQGTTTTTIEEKLQLTNNGISLRLFDVPGAGYKEFSYLDDSVIQWLRKVHVVVTVYQNSVTSCDRLVRLALAMGKQVIFVRNKVDLVRPDEASIEDVKKYDVQTIKAEYGLNRPAVFAVSALNIYDNKADIKNGEAPTREAYDWSLFEPALYTIAEALVEERKKTPQTDL